jgi:hypothetical protein
MNLDGLHVMVNGLDRIWRAHGLQAAARSGLVSVVCALPGCDGGFSYTVGGLQDGGSRMTVEQRLDQLEKRNKRLTVALTMMAMVAITIKLSACGEDPVGHSTNCDVSDVGVLAGRNLSECDLVKTNLEGANLEGVVSVPELSAKQEEDACWSDCG